MPTDKFNRPLQIVEEADQTVTVSLLDQQGQMLLSVNHSSMENCLRVIESHPPETTSTFTLTILETPPEKFVLVVLDTEKKIVQKITEDQIAETNLGDLGLENIRFIEINEPSMAFDCQLYVNVLTSFIEIIDDSTAAVRIDLKHLIVLKHLAATQIEKHYTELKKQLEEATAADYDQQLVLYQFKFDIDKKKSDLLKIVIDAVSIEDFLKQYKQNNQWPTLNHQA